MLTAIETLKWVTRRTTPPWRVSELRTFLKADPSKPFSLGKAITALEKGTCVLFVSVRDPSLLSSVSTSAELKAKWATSAPSKTTVTWLIDFLTARGASLKYHSGDWKTLAIQSPLGGLKTMTAVEVPTSGFGQWLKDEGDLTEKAGAALDAGGLEYVGTPLTLIGIGEWAAGSLLQSMDDVGSDVPFYTGYTGSSAGGDTGDGSGSGDTGVLVIPTITVTGSAPGGVDPTSIPEAPPVDSSDVPDDPGGPTTGDGGDGGGNGGGDAGAGG